MVKRKVNRAVSSSSKEHVCRGKVFGWKWLVFGLLILVNNQWWPRYNDWAFFGGLIALTGLVKLLHSDCMHCN